MKKFKLSFPATQQFAFVEWAVVNEISTVLSWLTEAEIFGTDKLHVICVCSEEKLNAVQQSEWKKYLSQSN